ncbi:MAG: pyrroloquinoline quinone precursor peptide PqqA [Gemmatimonadetes bacterium]|nr:MAG: pyrroloquinoline quinone precursor peptide PqqA [Gemmatimonadota bacterium]
MHPGLGEMTHYGSRPRGLETPSRARQSIVNKKVATADCGALSLARRLLRTKTVGIGRPPPFLGGREMTWTKPEFEVVELGMEVGAYAGNA